MCVNIESVSPLFLICGYITFTLDPNETPWISEAILAALSALPRHSLVDVLRWDGDLECDPKYQQHPP